ncbi:MAG: T9SS type A sorting domain-containing protein [Candidatus Eisenbacteria bacterium]|nr:T9SS type A sorting domain-containing protein [Candidatus Eisenbacteria bacterium]
MEAEKQQPTVLPVLVPDGAGGVFMAWEQGAWLRSWAVVERYTSALALAPGWPAGYASPESTYMDGYAPVMVSDGADGVVMAWLAAGLVASRMSPTGSIVPGWPVAITDAADAPGIVGDATGGALVVWQNSRNGTLYAQRRLANGTLAPGWLSGGLPVCTLTTIAGITRYAATRSQNYSSVASDGAGGAFIVWSDVRADLGDIYAQHVLANGGLAPGWLLNGMPICVAPGTQMAPAIVADGSGGAFVTWQDARAGSWAAYAQHVTGAGAIAPGWTPNGVPVSPGYGNHQIQRPTIDSAGSAIVAWQDGRCASTEIFASRVAADGSTPSVAGDPVAWAALASSRADSGFVRLTWTVTNGAGLPATIYCRQPDGPWMAVAVVPVGTDGLVRYGDQGAIAGCVYGYAMGIPSCGAPRRFGEVSVTIPNGSGFVPLAVARSAAAPDSSGITLTWKLNEGEGLPVAVFARDSCREWSRLGTTACDDTGLVSFRDATPLSASWREYRMVVHACGADDTLGDFVTRIPTAVDLVGREVASDHVQLAWHQTAGPLSYGRTWRQDSTGGMIVIGPVTAPNDGRYGCIDRTVLPGAHYRYWLGLIACRDEQMFGPVDVDIAPVPPTPPPIPKLDVRVAGGNPARGSFAVALSLVDASPARLEVFDAAGRLVLDRDVSGLGVGTHELALGDVATLRPGVFVIRLTQGGRTRTARATLLR